MRSRVLALAMSAPLVILVCATLWRTPYPINEAVALFEDAAKQPVSAFLLPESSYYRPVFHMSLVGIWTYAGPLELKLLWVKVLHITPVAILATFFVWFVRPRTWLDAVTAAVALMVLIGSPGLRDNLEIPLAYTAVGMPLALIAWRLLEDEPHWWRAGTVALLTVIAVGFKEQGLVLVPVVLAARWTRAPGASRTLVVGLGVFAVAYVVVRVLWKSRWPLFEQSMGLGFSILEPSEAAAQFGTFPYWMYAYNSVSTMANVLFAEPTGGLFFITRNLRYGGLEPWEVVHLASSAGLTAVIVWWGVGSLRNPESNRWSIESRTFVAFVVALLACGALSFNYSRDRLGGMATVYYALAAYFALRAAAVRLTQVSPPRFVAGSLVLVTIVAMWSLRAVGTLEWTRRTSFDNQVRWLIQLGPRRIEFADRPEYLDIMEHMVEQGTAPGAPRPTRYPRFLLSLFGPP